MPSDIKQMIWRIRLWKNIVLRLARSTPHVRAAKGREVRRREKGFYSPPDEDLLGILNLIHELLEQTLVRWSEAVGDRRLSFDLWRNEG